MRDWEALEADVVKLLNVHYTSGRSGRDVDFVVVHYNAGNLTIGGCWSVWQTREASAHYQVEDDGTIGQLVWDSNTAWHASNWDANCRSIGVEHANEPDGTITEECLDNGAHLVAAICKHFGLGRPQWLKNVYPHRYFAATSCPGQIYGSQADEYMARCQRWYDAMTGAGEAPSGGTSAPAQPTTGGKETADEASGTIVVGSKIKVTNPYDENGTHLVVSGTYDVIQVNGNRIVIARNGVVIAACPRSNLALVSGGGAPSATASSRWKVGAKVRVTNPYDEHGTHLAVSGTYNIIQIDGDRVVIGRGGAVTAACPKSNLALA